MEKLQIVVEVDSKSGKARIVELGDSIEQTAIKAKKALADAAKGMDALNKSGVKSSWSDQWNAGLQKATAMQKEAQAASKKLGDEVKNTGEKGRNGFKAAADGLSHLSGKMSPVMNMAVKLGGIFAAYKIGDFVKDTALAASRHETLGVVMETVGRNAGYSAAQMHGFDAALQKTGISMNESRNTLARMVQGQMDLNNATRLARIAQDAAVIGNINSSEAFERMIYGIQSAQPEMLRTIGLNVTFENGYKRLADQLGINTGQLTEHQKAQSRMNQVMDAGTMIAGTYNAAMGTAGKQITSFTRYIDDFKVLMGQAFGPAVTAMVADATQEIKALSITIQQPATREELKRLSMTALEAFKDLITVSKKIGEIFAITVSGWNSLPTIVQELGIVGALIGGVKARAALTALTLAIGGVKEYTEWIKRAGDEMDAQSAAADKSEAARINGLIAVGQSQLDNLKRQKNALSGQDIELFGPKLQAQIDAVNVSLNRLGDRLRSIGGSVQTGSSSGIDKALAADFDGIDKALADFHKNAAESAAAASAAAREKAKDNAQKYAEQRVQIGLRMTDEIKRMTLSEYEYNKWALDQEVADLSAKAAGDQTIAGQIAEYKTEKLAEIEEEHKKSLARQAEEERKAAEDIKRLKADLTDAINEMTMDEFAYRQFALDQEIEALKAQAANKQEILDQIGQYQILRQAEIDMERQEATFASEHQVMDALRESWGLTWEEIRAGQVDVWADLAAASAWASRDIANGFIAVASGSKSAKQAGMDMLRSIAAQAIATLIQIGVQKVILGMIEKKTMATTVAGTVIGMAAIEAAAAPAAMMVSIATGGGSAAAGAAAFTLAMGTMTGAYAATKATIAGISAGTGGAVAAGGGIFDKPTLTIFGEEGPEAVVPLSPQRRSERDAILSRIAPGGSGESVIHVDIGGIHFHGDVKLDTDMHNIRTQIGNAVEDAIRGAVS